MKQNVTIKRTNDEIIELLDVDETKLAMDEVSVTYRVSETTEVMIPMHQIADITAVRISDDESH
jgi:hypothetical protein